MQRLLGGQPVPGGEQGPGQGQRGPALLGGEEAVPAGERETVRVADGGHRDDVDAEVEVAHHAADQCQLLGVLLPEERRVRPGEVEELGDDGEHAVEVPGARGALQPLAHGARGDTDLGLAAGVDLLDGGGEDRVGAGRRGDGEIGVQGAGVAVEVGGLAELERVDEDGDHDLAAGPRGCPCGTDQGGMAVVERAHRHHDGAARPGGPAEGVELRGGAQQGGGCGVHRFSPGPDPSGPCVPFVPVTAPLSDRTPRRS